MRKEVWARVALNKKLLHNLCVCLVSFKSFLAYFACILNFITVFNNNSFARFHDPKRNYCLLSLVKCANCWTIIFCYYYLPPLSILLTNYLKRLSLSSICCLDSRILIVWFRDRGRVLPEGLVQQLNMCMFPRLVDKMVVPSPGSVKMSMTNAGRRLSHNTCLFFQIEKIKW